LNFFKNLKTYVLQRISTDYSPVSTPLRELVTISLLTDPSIFSLRYKLSMIKVFHIQQQSDSTDHVKLYWDESIW